MNSMNDKRRRIPSNRSIIRNINNALLIGKNSQSKSKENSSDNAISQKSRLMKYQAESMIRPPVDHQKPQSIYLKLSRHEKELMPNNNNITTYHNIPNAKGINKTAIGTEYNASQKFLRIFPDNIDTRLGIGEMLLNDDSILLTDSNLINDIVPNSVFDSNELSNVKLNFNEWNMKIMSSTNSKKANHIQNSSNPKNKLNEIIANVTPFDNNFQSNKLPLSIPHHQGISITDNGRSNLLTTSTNSNGNVLTTGSKDNKEIKKLNNKSSKNQRNTNRQMQSKNAKTIHNPSFHNESLSGRTTVNSNSNNNSNKTNNNNHYQHVLLYKHKDPFVLNNADSEGGRKNNSKDSRRKLKEKIDSKSKDTVMKYLKILFGEQLESFNEKILDEKLDEPSIKDLFRQLAFHALNQENTIKEMTKQNKRMEKELKEKNKETFELSTQLHEIKSNLIGLIKTTDKITNKKITQSNKSIKPSKKNCPSSDQTLYSLQSH